MTRQQLAAEMFDAMQSFRDVVQTLKVEAVFLERRYPGNPSVANMKAASDKATRLVSRVDGLIESYVACDSGPVKA